MTSTWADSTIFEVEKASNSNGLCLVSSVTVEIAFSLKVLLLGDLRQLLFLTSQLSDCKEYTLFCTCPNICLEFIPCCKDGCNMKKAYRKTIILLLTIELLLKMAPSIKQAVVSKIGEEASLLGKLACLSSIFSIL